MVVGNRLELSSGSSDQLNQPAGPSYPILTTVPRGITLKKRKKQRHVMQLLYFPLWHFNHKKMLECPINLVPFIIFSEETCAASCAQLLSQTAGVTNSQLLKNVPQYYCKVWEKHPILEITCQYSRIKYEETELIAQVKENRMESKRFLQQESWRSS